MQPDTAATRYGLKLYKFAQPAKSIAQPFFMNIAILVSQLFPDENII
jgi:hypothetical protein